MNDKQRIKLVRLFSILDDPTIRVLDKFYPDKNKSRPVCYELKFKVGDRSDDPTIVAYIGVVFGEILRFEFDDELWDSAMRRGEACPDNIKSVIDKFLIARAEHQSRLCKQEILLKTNKQPNTAGVYAVLIKEILKEIEND